MDCISNSLIHSPREREQRSLLDGAGDHRGCRQSKRGKEREMESIFGMPSLRAVEEEPPTGLPNTVEPASKFPGAALSNANERFRHKNSSIPAKTPYVKREERERITGPMWRGMEEEGRERELGRQAMTSLRGSFSSSRVPPIQE